MVTGAKDASTSLLKHVHSADFKPLFLLSLKLRWYSQVPPFDSVHTSYLSHGGRLVFGYDGSPVIHSSNTELARGSQCEPLPLLSALALTLSQGTSLQPHSLVQPVTEYMCLIPPTHLPPSSASQQAG